MSPAYESWLDRQIREAQERGEFDNLAGAGKPLAFLDQPQDEDWWIKGLIEREKLDVTAALPPQLALRKEAQYLPDEVLVQRSERDVRDLVEDFNARVRECWRRPVEGPLVVVRTVDVERLVAHWRAHREALAARTAGHSAARAADSRRDAGGGWWSRAWGRAARRRGRGRP